MKHLAILVLVVVMLVTLTGAASAGQPPNATFTIRGYTTDYSFRMLSNGLTSYHLLASGGRSRADRPTCLALYGRSCQATCQTLLSAPCGVSGYFDGEFTYEEWGTVDFDPITGVGSGQGVNRSVLTVDTAEGQVTMDLSGSTALEGVSGRFDLRQHAGSGAYQGLKGRGDYSGSAGMVFAVTFNGNFR